MSPKPYALGGKCRKGHLLTEDNTYIEGTRLRCKDCRDVWKPPHPRVTTHLKNCPHDGSEHVQNINGYWVCKACQRERMQERRAAEGPGIGTGGVNKAKTECPQHHEYTEANTWINPKTGSRHCRTCARENGKVQNLKRYSLTAEQFQAMLDDQGNRCALCRAEFTSTRDRHIDHDHSCCGQQKSCGKCLRGIVCSDCNHGLGFFHDDTTILQSAIDYLVEHGA